MRIILVLTFIFFHTAFSLIEYTYLICKKLKRIDNSKLMKILFFYTLKQDNFLEQIF